MMDLDQGTSGDIFSEPQVSLGASLLLLYGFSGPTGSRVMLVVRNNVLENIESTVLFVSGGQ